MLCEIKLKSLNWTVVLLELLSNSAPKFSIFGWVVAIFDGLSIFTSGPTSFRTLPLAIMRNIILCASSPFFSPSSFSFSNIKTNSPSSKMLKEKREFKSVTEICKREHFNNLPWLNRSTLAVPETPWWNKHGTCHHSIQQWLPDRSCDCTFLKKCQTLGSVRWTCLQSLRLNPKNKRIYIITWAWAIGRKGDFFFWARKIKRTAKTNTIDLLPW